MRRRPATHNQRWNRLGQIDQIKTRNHRSSDHSFEVLNKKGRGNGWEMDGLSRIPNRVSTERDLGLDGTKQNA